MAGVNHGSVSAGNIVADPHWIIVGHMKNATVLNIGAPANKNLVDISPNHGLKPDAGMLVDRNCADHIRSSSHEDCRRKSGLLVKKTLPARKDFVLSHRVGKHI